MKSIFKSKTAALGFVTSLAGAASFFFPEVNDFVAANSGAILAVLGVIGLVLRIVTKDKVVLYKGE
jgi:hypothetical protein